MQDGDFSVAGVRDGGNTVAGVRTCASTTCSGDNCFNTSEIQAYHRPPLSGIEVSDILSKSNIQPPKRYIGS